MDIKPTPSDFNRNLIIGKLVELAIAYNNRNKKIMVSVNYAGYNDAVTVILQDSQEYTIIAMVSVNFGKIAPILAETMMKDYETAKNLLK